MHNKSNLFVLGGLVGSTVVTGMVLAGPQVLADENHTATASVTVSSACSMTAVTASGNEHVATLLPGINSSDMDDYKNGIGSTTITAFCNDSGGFAIYAVGYSGDTEGNTDMIGSVPGYNIATGTATSGDTSQWSMRIGSLRDVDIMNGYNNYHAVPSSYTKVASHDASTSVSGSQITTTYAAYIAPTQVAATYEGKVKYTMAHPSTNDCPDGYSLINNACKKVTYMQDVATWGSELQVGDSIQAIDKRDGKTYSVAKLADGNIWMTQNLALGDANGITITNVDSDLNNGVTSFTISSSKARSATGSDWSDSYTDPEFAYHTNDTDNYGNYYNWPAAVAGTVVDSGNASSSICPKGWRLPTGGPSGELEALYGAYNGDYTNFIAATSFVFSGYYYYGLDAQGNDGCWLSSTADYGDSAHALYGGIIPDANISKYYGYSVRCVASGS